MPKEDFEQFHQMVLQDISLQESLRVIEYRNDFIAAVVEKGKEKGFDFGAEDVEEKMNEYRRAWIERWF
ncbi:MAG: Nif11-like leader peptide family natural product precursor [Pyrinomonadaceae bacterium]|nr:Nif11-like leader peptide family natural product precursor [Pyrinomonadaceae bacterium]